MQNLFLGLAARKKKVHISTEKNLLDIAITKQIHRVKQDNEISNTKFPPASKEWINTVYSFNPNYIKPLTMVDIMVNRLIKSYFNFSKLIWKKKYKFSAITLKNKFRLIKRRKRAERKKNKLSLNKVFVSKGEMKHTNNVVVATFYIFNKTKKFLLYKLNRLNAERETFLLSNRQNLLNSNNSQENKKASIAFVSSLASPTSSKRQLKNNVKAKNVMGKRWFESTNKESKVSTQTNKKNIRLVELKNKSYDEIVFNFSDTKNKIINSKVRPALYKSKPKYTNKTVLATKSFIENKVSNVNNYYSSFYLANLTKRRLSRFISRINNTNIRNKYVTLMKNLYSGLSKYKLYNVQDQLNNNSNHRNVAYSTNFLDLSNNGFNGSNIPLSAFYKLLNRNHILDLSRYAKYFSQVKNSTINVNRKSNITPLVQILKTFYKSFALYNVKSLANNSIDPILKSLSSSDLTLHNRKLFISKINNESTTLNNTTKDEKRKTALLDTLSNNKHKTSLSVYSPVEGETVKINKIKAMKLKAIRLINKIRRYKKFIVKSLSLELNINSNDFNKRFVAYERDYINNFLKKTYRKEWLYIRYVKMLLLNNNKYKNPFILGLKNVVSKLYNKRVEFNFVNLKYIYLNSDILSRSIATRLRNRQNRLLTVLNKAVLMVNIPSINNKWEFTSSNLGKARNVKDNKYSSILSYFLALASISNSRLGNEVGKNIRTVYSFAINNNDKLNLLLKNLYSNNAPCSIESKNLSITQKNALHSVNNKAVFGVRLEAKGRLTKRLTASRSVSKLKYRGSIKNFNSSNYGISSVILKGNLRSNLQYTKISSKTRNGSFGLKGWISAY